MTGGPFEVGLTADTLYDQSIEVEALANVDVMFRSVDVESTDDVINELVGVDAVIDRLSSVPYPAPVVDRLAAGGCRVLARCGIGVDSINHERAAEQGMYVVNVPVYCQEEVANHTLLSILALQRNMISYNKAMHAGRWDRRLSAVSIPKSSNQTLGLVGFGSIARRVAERVHPLGMDVIATDPEVDAETMADHGVDERSHDRVLSESDVISIHTPLTEGTRGLFDAAAFKQMREGAYLVNVARGGIVDETALAAAIDDETIAGAALDVHAKEPADKLEPGKMAPFESPLQDHKNVLLTPHVAWFSAAAEETKRRRATADVRRVLTDTKPENPVNEL